MKCTKCGANKLKWWHYYSKYGVNGAYHCKNCAALFRCVKDRKTLKRKVGRFIKYLQKEAVLKAKESKKKFYTKRKK